MVCLVFWSLLVIKHLEKRFDELLSQADVVAATRQIEHSQLWGTNERVDSDLLLGWCVKARNLLASACGRESEHFTSFVDAEKPKPFETNPATLSRLRAVFLAAKEDFEGGYLSSVRNLVQAEVFPLNSNRPANFSPPAIDCPPLSFAVLFWKPIYAVCVRRMACL